MRIGYGVASAALFLSLLVTAAAPGKAESAGTLLQIQPAFAPLAYSGKVYLFNSAGRLEVVPLEGKAASAVSDLPAAPILPPVSTPGGPCFMDGQGRLWNAASAPPSLISSPGPGAVALVPTDGRPAVVYPDRLILPDGRSVALPLRTKGAVQLSDGGYWIYGDHGAARLDAKGAALWTWTSETLRPTTACLAGNSIYSGTQNGIFAALRAKNGKTRWRYPAGGPIEDVVPVDSGRAEGSLPGRSECRGGLSLPSSYAKGEKPSWPPPLGHAGFPCIPSPGGRCSGPGRRLQVRFSSLRWFQTARRP
ncbi:MAG: hypothetical protein P8Z49_12210 [Acidobacteriota bacterium]